MSPLRYPAKARAPRSLIVVSIQLVQRHAWARRRTRATVQKPFQRRGEVWRYLGMIQGGDGNCEHMAEQLRLRVGEAAEVLSRKKMSRAGAIYLSSVVIMLSKQLCAMYRPELPSGTAGRSRRAAHAHTHTRARARA
jgi:hypothetical protein